MSFRLSPLLSLLLCTSVASLAQPPSRDSEAASTDHDAEETLLSQLEESRAKKRALEASFEEDYREKPDSEGAKAKYIIWLIDNRRFEDADKVTEELETLNPGGAQAAVFRKYLPQLRTKEEPRLKTEMMKEWFQAIVTDMEKQRGIEAGTVDKLLSGDENGLWKAGEEVNARRRAEIRSRFPDLCRSLRGAGGTHDDWKTRGEFWDIQTKKGEDGLLEAYPSFLQRHAHMPGGYEEYAKFFLRREDYGRFDEVVGSLSRKFPDSAITRLLKEAQQELGQLASAEQRRHRGARAAEELMYLGLELSDCASRNQPPRNEAP